MKTMDMKTFSAWDILTHSFQQLGENHRAFIQIFGLWILILVGLDLLMAAVVGIDVVLISQAHLSHAPHEFSGLLANALTFASICIYSMCKIIIAVAWHRFILLGEHDGKYSIAKSGQRYWAYLGWTLLLLLVLLCPVGAGALILYNLDLVLGMGMGVDLLLGIGAAFVALIATILYFGPLTSRLQIKLATLALKQNIGLGEIRTATKGHYLFFLGIFIFTVVLISASSRLFSRIVDFAYSIEPNVLPFAAGLVMYVPDMAIHAVLVGMISNLYKRFMVEDAAPADQSDQPTSPEL